jgi:vitamin B12 transporter
MKNRFLRTSLLALALLLTGQSTAFAQSHSNFQPIVVTATRSQTPLTHVLADVSIIDRETLQESGLQSLAEVLATLPGVQFSSNGSYRSSSGIFLRGATTAQTILLIDGVRVGSATSGSFSLEGLPLDRIERVEVLRGAAAALYGPDAVGGVIQVLTREPAQGVQKTATAGLGSDGQRQLGASIQGREGTWGFRLGASNEHAKGISVKLPGATDFNPDKDSYDFSSFDAKLQYKLDEQQSFALSLLASDGEYGFDSKTTGLTASNTLALSYPSVRQAVFAWRAKLNSDWHSLLTMARSQELAKSRYLRESDQLLFSETQFNTARNQVTWQNDVRWAKGTLTLLAEGMRDKVNSTTLYTVSERSVQGVMASYSWRDEVWDALATVRFNRNSQFGNFNVWSLSGGYTLNDRWKFVANTGTTFQAPTFNQLYWPCANPCTSSSYKGDPNLKPQEGQSEELGLRYKNGTTRASVVIYQNEINGFITPATNVQSNMAVLKGATLSWEDSWGDTSLVTSYDHGNHRIKPSNERIARVANDYMSLRINHRYGALKPYVEIRLSGDRMDGKVKLPGYGIANLGASYQWDKNWKVLARLNNLDDKIYALANGYTMPGRNLFVSMQWAD